MRKLIYRGDFVLGDKRLERRNPAARRPIAARVPQPNQQRQVAVLNRRLARLRQETARLTETLSRAMAVC